MIKNLLKPTKTKRLAFFLLTDTVIFSVSLYLSILISSGIEGFSFSEKTFFFLLPLFVLGKIFILKLNKIYSVNWRFVGLHEFYKISTGLFLFMLIAYSVDFLLSVTGVTTFSFMLPAVDFFISLPFVLFLRASKRIYLEVIRGYKREGNRTLILGAGYTGETILRDIIRNKEKQYNPVGILDDDPNKIGTNICSVPVLGSIDSIEDVCRENKIETVIIAIPSLNHTKIRRIFDRLTSVGVKDIKVVPSISRLPKDAVSVKDIRDISIEDLLSREEVKIDKEKIGEFINGKVVFVSGAGGSIGSEIVRQLINFFPEKIIMFEIDETELHNLMFEVREQAKNNGVDLYPIVGDVRDKGKLERIFSSNRIDVVFHAAAYKHVPLMEFHPEEAIKTNIFGTFNLADVSVKYEVEKFVNISTDKAVNPTSIMGATKRVAEIICSTFNQKGITKFVSVRFGNVLGSRGSVIPIFLEQIKRGGPITVTHPEMKRYFMTIPEAVLLVFQAAAISNGGEVFVLDMGNPVRIVKLAEELIKLHGLEPYKDIDIVYTGLRPGEKLFEELLTAEEGTYKTNYEKIFIAKISHSFSMEEINKFLNDILLAINKGDKQEIKSILERFVPFYKEQRSLAERN